MVFFAVALVLAGAMTSAASVAADTKLEVGLLTFAATLAFLSGGYLLGARAGGRVKAALHAHLSGARAVQSRLRQDGLVQKRERAGLIAELADAQALLQELAHRNTALLAQLAHRIPPTVARMAGRSRRSLKS